MPDAALRERARRFAGPCPDRRVRAIFDRLAAVIEPVSDLRFEDPYQLLVAVVLSAQATDKSVNKAAATLFPAAPTPQAMLELGVEGLKRHIRSIGLFNSKALNVIALSRILVEEHGGVVPQERAALEALPGVGRKTANVVLNIAFGQPTIAVDTHVQRVANRLGIAATTRPADTEAVLLLRTPRKHLRHAHHYLILHGRYCCTARRPACQRCPVERQCDSVDKTV